jgi:hypothetical protein
MVSRHPISPPTTIKTMTPPLVPPPPPSDDVDDDTKSGVEALEGTARHGGGRGGGGDGGGRGGGGRGGGGDGRYADKPQLARRSQKKEVKCSTHDGDSKRIRGRAAYAVCSS